MYKMCYNRGMKKAKCKYCEGKGYVLIRDNSFQKDFKKKIAMAKDLRRQGFTLAEIADTMGYSHG